MRVLRVILLLMLLVGAGLKAWAVEDGFLISLVNESLANNPQVQALKKEWQAQEAGIISKKSLEQPEIGFTYFGESIQTKTGPQEAKFSIKQKFPFPTKLSLRGKIASKRAERSFARYVLAVRNTIEQTKSNFYNYYFASQSIKVLKEEKIILESISRIVQKKYETLNVSQQDLVKIELEISQITAKILKMSQQQNFLRAELNKLLARPASQALELPQDYSLSAVELFKAKEELLHKSFKESPLILLEKAALKEQEFKLSLAKEGYKPDFGIMADYIQIGDGTTNLADDGKDAWMVGLNMTIPLWVWKIKSDIRSEQFRLESSQKLLKSKEDFISFKVEDLYFKVKTYLQLIDLYENVILPQSLQNYFVSKSSYEADEIDFINLLDAQRNLIRIKLSLLKQVVGYRGTLARLEYIIGENLEE